MPYIEMVKYGAGAVILEYLMPYIKMEKFGSGAVILEYLMPYIKMGRFGRDAVILEYLKLYMKTGRCGWEAATLEPPMLYTKEQMVEQLLAHFYFCSKIAVKIYADRKNKSVLVVWLIYLMKANLWMK